MGPTAALQLQLLRHTDPRSVPPNVSFFVDDLEEQWTYNDPFDLIYFRMMVGSITDWPRLLSQAYQ